MNEYIENKFVKYLVDEVMSNSNMNYKQAYELIIDFKKTKLFCPTFEKWCVVNKIKYPKQSGRVRHIKELF